MIEMLVSKLLNLTGLVGVTGGFPKASATMAQRQEKFAKEFEVISSGHAICISWNICLQHVVSGVSKASTDWAIAVHPLSASRQPF